MPGDRGWVVYQSPPGAQDAEEHVDVLTTAGRRACSEPLVEAPDPQSRVPIHREVGTRSVVADLEREQRDIGGRVRPVVRRTSAEPDHPIRFSK